MSVTRRDVSVLNDDCQTQNIFWKRHQRAHVHSRALNKLVLVAVGLLSRPLGYPLRFWVLGLRVYALGFGVGCVLLENPN